MLPNGGCILYDPQFSTTTGNAAPWDGGVHEIERFIKSHECSKYCRVLKLADLKVHTPPRPRPRPRPRKPKSKSQQTTVSESRSAASVQVISDNDNAHNGLQRSRASSAAL